MSEQAEMGIAVRTPKMKSKVPKDWHEISGALRSAARCVARQGVWLGTALALVQPGLAFAGPEEDAVSAALAAARADVDAGRCDQAFARLSEFPGLQSRAHLLAGQCRIRAGRYPEALRDLDRARGDRELTAKQIGDIELYRGVALYHLERYTEAAAALASADGITTQDAQLSLYRGLISLRDGDNDRAAPALESAARLAPRLTEPVASYYAGLAWQGAAERSKAREAFLRVIEIDGDGPWGKEAKKLLETTELFPYYVRGSAGIEHDTNVVLRGDNVTETVVGANALSSVGEKATRAVWEIDAGVQLFSLGQTSGGLTFSYYGNAHFDVPDLDTHYPTVGAYLAQRLGANTVAQARYSYGRAWVDDADYLQTSAAELSLTHTWEKAGTTVIVADFLSNDLLFNPADVPGGVGCGNLTGGCGPANFSERRERKRDGESYGGALEHRYLVPLPNVVTPILEEVEVGGGYRFRYYDSRGQEWQHMSHIVSAGMQFEFPLDFSFATSASYEYRDFENPSTFPDAEVIGQPFVLSTNDREEHEVNFEAEIEKDITDHFSVSTRYSYLNNFSNRDVYDYDRHIVGGYVNFRFD